jgi:uncharacterized protein YeaC (DUF1315 family)
VVHVRWPSGLDLAKGQKINGRNVVFIIHETNGAEQHYQSMENLKLS